MLRRFAVLAIGVLVLAGCSSGGGGDEAVASTTTSPVTTTAAPVTSTTVLARERKTFPITTGTWVQKFNTTGLALLGAIGAEVPAKVNVEGAGPLYGGRVTDNAAVYLEAEEPGGAVQAVVIVLPEGSATLPVRLISVVGMNALDITDAADFAGEFNNRVTPFLETLRPGIDTIAVTTAATVHVVVEGEQVRFVWTPPGEMPSDAAKNARY